MRHALENHVVTWQRERIAGATESLGVLCAQRFDWDSVVSKPRARTPRRRVGAVSMTSLVEYEHGSSMHSKANPVDEQGTCMGGFEMSCGSCSVNLLG